MFPPLLPPFGGILPLGGIGQPAPPLEPLPPFGGGGILPPLPGGIGQPPSEPVGAGAGISPLPGGIGQPAPPLEPLPPLGGGGILPPLLGGIGQPPVEGGDIPPLLLFGDGSIPIVLVPLEPQLEGG